MAAAPILSAIFLIDTGERYMNKNKTLVRVVCGLMAGLMVVSVVAGVVSMFLYV